MKQKEITIRRGTPEDAALLAELGAETFGDTFATQNTTVDMASYLAASFSPAIQAEELADPRVSYLLAEVEGEAVGFAKLMESQPEAAIHGPRPYELVRIYARKAWIGRGVGAFLMQACLDEAARLEFETLWLGVWEHNPRARAFYRRWGFIEVGSHAFTLGKDVQTDILMERPVRL